MRILRKVRIPLGIVAGPILGNFCAVFAAAGIDASYGEQVTGGHWNLTLPNVIYAIVIGFFTGFIAGFIGKKRGGLLGALSQFLPLLFIVLLSLYLNRDLLGGYQVKPAVWTWIGLVPAIFGGRFGGHLANDETTISLLKSVGWHWSWIWLVLAIYIFFLAGSIRFLLIDIVMGWEIIFIPRLWTVMFFVGPLIASLLYATFSLPLLGLTMLFGSLGKVEHGERLLSNWHPIFRVLLVVIGVPLVLTIVWWLNSIALNVLVTNGLRIP